ncbi:MAG: DUF4058 family protein [Fimbriimonadales bacterium]
MTNPFPGMNPYLEQRRFWGGVHHRLITYTADALQTQLRPRYFVNIEERVYIEESQRAIVPDVALLQAPHSPSVSVATRPNTYDPPLLLQADARPHTEGAIHIYDTTQQMRLVTVIEVLSPTNKEPNTQGRTLYLRKQAEVLKSTVHLVEIDLLREGDYTLAAPWSRVREQVGLGWHYMVSISCADDPEHYWLYPRTVRERLPVFPVPLVEGQVGVDLQALVDRCYEDGGYGDVIDYTQPPPPPPFRAEDEAWIDALLREKGLR